MNELTAKNVKDSQIGNPLVELFGILSASRQRHSERRHFLIVANQQDVADQHGVVPGFALDRLEARELRELVGARLNQRHLALL
jgi:hypothetical protein